MEKLYTLFLPQEILSYFEIVKVEDQSELINLYLDELPLSDSENPDRKYYSKGFYESSSIQDFPIRGKQVFLFLRRRHWTDMTTGLPFMRDLSYVAQGTRITEEFASFLKGLH